MTEMEEIAKHVRAMREFAKVKAKESGIDLSGDTKQSYYMNGKVQAFTDILCLIDPHPFN